MKKTFKSQFCNFEILVIELLLFLAWKFSYRVQQMRMFVCAGICSGQSGVSTLVLNAPGWMEARGWFSSTSVSVGPTASPSTTRYELLPATDPPNWPEKIDMSKWSKALDAGLVYCQDSACPCRIWAVVRCLVLQWSSFLGIMFSSASSLYGQCGVKCLGSGHPNCKQLVL